MKPAAVFPRELRILWYRFRRYPVAALQSFLLVVLLAFFTAYLLQVIYPDFQLLNKAASFAGYKHNKKYKFFTGQEGGAYSSIGEVVEQASYEDGNTIDNCNTNGGYDNILKLTIERNSFAIVQEDAINPDDRFNKNFRDITPLFMERMHIMYRKDLFKHCQGAIQLSASTDTAFLRCLNDKVKRVNVGLVGTGTRVLASYVMALLDQQINRSLHSAPKYRQVGSPFKTAFTEMLACKQHPGNADDIVFYMQADPVSNVKNVLDAGDYGLLSIDVSFISTLNKRFDLNLLMVDFKEKYRQADTISTFATPAHLVTSVKTGNQEALQLINKIQHCKDSINSRITGLSKDSLNGNYKYSLPLDEYGFFNTVNDEYAASSANNLKEIAALVIPVFAFLLPLFKSIRGIKSIIKRWRINKEIDYLVKPVKSILPKDASTIRIQLLRLKNEVTDLYGDGILCEIHYKPLLDRINLHLEK